jgi:hypothetical protein
MDTTHLKALGAGLFFLFIFLSGFWLSRSGKPYSPVIFNIHKLIGLATGIFLIITVYQVHQVTPLGLAQIAAIAINVLLFAVDVAAGGLLSIDKPMPSAVARVHKVFPYLIALSTAATLYLLLFQA